MKDIIFLCEPRTFKTVENNTFVVNGISAMVDNSQSVAIGSNEDIVFALTFWSLIDNNYEVTGTVKKAIPKTFNIPTVGVVSIISGLFSENKQVIYDMASIICGYIEYTLKPFSEQINLNSNG